MCSLLSPPHQNNCRGIFHALFFGLLVPAFLSPWEEDHVEDEDEGAGAEDGDDDGKDDVQLPVLLLLQAET